MEILRIEPADIQVTLRLSINEISRLLTAFEKAEVRYDSSIPGDADGKDMLIGFFRDLKAVHDDVSGDIRGVK